jgi:hypothetical protein
VRLLVVALGLLVIAAPLHAQQMVITNDTLDAERRDVRDVLVVLRDSLRTVEAAAAQFERGHASASLELLYSQGQRIKNACIRSLRNIGPAREVVKADDWDDAYRTLQQSELLEAMDTLEESLNDCDEVWDSLATLENEEELRSSGPGAAESITKDIHDYASAVSGYFKALGVYVSPIGASRTSIP